MSNTEKIIKWINSHEEEMLDDIRKLVSIPSVSEINMKQSTNEESLLQSNRNSPYGESCRKVLDKILEIGETYGFSVLEYDGHMGEIKFGDSKNEIGVFGHLDVVPAESGWHYPPFQLTRIGNYIIGRGVQDNKGPVIAVMFAMRYLQESNSEMPLTIRLFTGCDEENGMSDVKYLLSKYSVPKMSFVADCGFPVCIGEKGILNLTLTKELANTEIRDFYAGDKSNTVPSSAYIRINDKQSEKTIKRNGVSGHAAFPNGTVNAISLLCSAINENKHVLSLLSASELSFFSFLGEVTSNGYGNGFGIQCVDELFGPLTCNLGLVRMEESKIIMKLDIRYPTSCNTAEIIDSIKNKIKKYEVRISSIRDEKPFVSNGENVFVKDLIKAYSEITKKDGYTYVMGGGTYAKFIPNSVGFGPGFGDDFSKLGFSDNQGKCHSIDEAQSIKDLKKAVEIYALAFQYISEDYSKIINDK